MSTLRGSRQFANVQVENLRFQRGTIPAGTTGGYALTVSNTGQIIPATSLVTDNLTVNAGITAASASIAGDVSAGSVTTTFLTAGTTPFSMSAAAIMNGNVGINGTLTILTPGPSVLYGGVTGNLQVPYLLVGATAVPFTPPYVLDVSGESRFQNDAHFVAPVDIETLNIVSGGDITLFDGSGTTIGYITATAGGLDLQSNFAVNFGKVGVPPVMTLLTASAPPTLQFQNGTIQANTIYNPLGTLAIPGAATVSNTLTALGNVDVRGSIINGASAATPVQINDRLTVTGHVNALAGVNVAGGMTVSSGPLRAAGGLSTTTIAASGAANIQGAATIGGNLTVTNITPAGGTLNVVSTIAASASTAPAGFGKGNVYCGSLIFPAASSSRVVTNTTNLEFDVGTGGNFEFKQNTGNNALFITPDDISGNVSITFSGGDLVIGNGIAPPALRINNTTGLIDIMDLNASGNAYFGNDVTIGHNLTVSTDTFLVGNVSVAARVQLSATNISGNIFHEFTSTEQYVNSGAASGTTTVLPSGYLDAGLYSVKVYAGTTTSALDYMSGGIWYLRQDGAGTTVQTFTDGSAGTPFVSGVSYVGGGFQTQFSGTTAYWNTIVRTV